MDDNTTYLLELFHSQVDRENYQVASSLLKLLTPRLSSSEIKRLRTEIPSKQKTHLPVKERRSHGSGQQQRSAQKTVEIRPSNKQHQEKEIRAIVNERKIEYLVHFTQAYNVASILKYGLIPLKWLPSKLGPRYKNVRVNDQWRHDGHTDASCLSITFPNYRMFFRLRQHSLDTLWTVLLIHPQVLWERDCAFYNCNAANQKWNNIPTGQLKTVSAFKALFDEYEDDTVCVERSQLGVRDFHTTNPQAEVLVFDIIPPKDIVAVCLPYYNGVFSEHVASWQGTDVRFEPVYFGRRTDYEFWSKPKKEPS